MRRGKETWERDYHPKWEGKMALLRDDVTLTGYITKPIQVSCHETSPQSQHTERLRGQAHGEVETSLGRDSTSIN